MADANLGPRLTERTATVLVLEREEAERFRADGVDDAHLLLGLIREEEGIGAAALAALGIELDRARAEVIRLLGGRRLPLATLDEVVGTLGVEFPVTPATIGVFALASWEADALGHRYIGTEHVLLGLMRVAKTGLEIVENLGADGLQVRNEVIRLLSRRVTGKVPVSSVPFEGGRRGGGGAGGGDGRGGRRDRGDPHALRPTGESRPAR